MSGLAAPVASGAILSSTGEDVAFAYRLFLGREAESGAVLDERARQPRDVILHAFLTSDEHRALLAEALRPDGIVPRALRIAPATDLIDWVIRWFDPPDQARPRIERAPTLLGLLAALIELPEVAASLVGYHGEAEAKRLAERMNAAAAQLRAIPTSVAASEAGASAEDVHNLYLLVHGRIPDSATAAAPRPHQPVRDAAMDFLASSEFAANVVPAALDGQLGDPSPLPPALRQWTCATFGIDLPETADRQAALVALLRQPETRGRLGQAGLLWSVEAVATAFDRAALPLGGTRRPASLRSLVEGSGLFDPEWYFARYPALRAARVDPLAHFVQVGINEGRDPGPGFDTAVYVERYPEAAASGLVAFEHYLRVGRDAGFDPRGAPEYARWLARFDDLTPEDRDRIEAAADRVKLGPILCLHITRSHIADDATIAAAVATQVGARPDLRLVGRGPAEIAPATALDGVAAGTLLVISGDGAVLRPQACFAFADALRRSGARLAYADHDHLDAEGRRARPVFKPAMSREFMTRLPYAGPVVALRLAERDRPAVVDALDRASRGDVAAALATLLLRAADDEVARVAMPLFTLPASATASPEDVIEPGAPDPPTPPLPPALPSIAVLIPTRDRVDLLKSCIESIVGRSDYPRDRLRLIILDNDSVEPATLDYLDELARRPGCTVLPAPGPFNFARICNAGAAAADADLLVFLNNDTVVREADWLAGLAACAMRPGIGAVGARLLFPNGTVQHGGTILGLGGEGGHRLLHATAEEARARDVTREMTSVTGACLALRRDRFAQVGGFDERLAVGFNDVDLCLRLIEAGYRNLYLARSLLTHDEAGSRGQDDTADKQARQLREAVHARARFRALFQDDPSHSPNLSLQEAGRLAFPPRAVRSWRRDPARPRVLIASAWQGVDHGIGRVVALQANRFRQRGWEVLMVGPAASADASDPRLPYVRCATAEQAACVAVAEGVDCVVAHDAPFFSMTRYLGADPPVYVVDHGNPPPRLFADERARNQSEREKRFCLPLAARVLATSRTVQDAQFDPRAVLLRNGNDHLGSWSPDWLARRREVRDRLGFGDAFLALSVAGLTRAERAHEGVEDLLALAAELPFAAPSTAGHVTFALAGRGAEEDATALRAAGLIVIANLSDAELADLYAASDLYLGLARWAGYAFGAGQALAMGLEVVASDIAAHRELDVNVASALPELCRQVEQAFARRGTTLRQARVEPWLVPLDRLVDMAEADRTARDAPLI